MCQSFQTCHESSFSLGSVDKGWAEGGGKEEGGKGTVDGMQN